MNKADSIFRQTVEEDGFSESVKSAKRKEEIIANNKLRRRSKKDKIGRNFICGCGKRYLSYPALYTHIKTKHDGVHPEGTKQCTNSKTKRGRPKKHDFREDDKTSILDSHLTNNINNNNNNPKSEFIHILSEGFSAEDLSVLKTLDISCIGKCDPKAFFNRLNHLRLNIKMNMKNKETHPFLHIFEKIENGENLLSKPNCNFVFSLFLFHASKIVSSKFYNILAIFFNHLRECLNSYGYTLIQEIKERNEKVLLMDFMNNTDIENKKEEYCENENPEDIPYIVNFFILNYLPKHSHLFDQDLAVRLMVDFTKFLNKNNFSQKKIGFNQSKLEETISFRDIFENKE